MTIIDDEDITDNFKTPGIFDEKLQTLNQQLPAILDDFKKYYVFFNKNPEYPEYQNSFENIKGNMFLEVIAEDTYFTPYKTEYLTEVSRKVEVISVNGKSKESLTESESVDITDSKPKVTISDIKNDDALLIKEHVNRINKNITRSNLNIFKKEDKAKVIKTIQNYLTENKVENSLYDKIMTELYTLLSDDLS